MPRILQFSLFLILLIPFFQGCNKGGLPGLVPGKGEVIYDGTPLPDAVVTFLPSKGLSEGRRSATAMTDSEGKFQLRTLNPNDGIFPGEYIITVSKLESPPPITPEDQEKILMGQKRPPLPNMNPKHLIAKEYSAKETTNLKYTIPAKGDKNIKLELQP